MKKLLSALLCMSLFACATHETKSIDKIKEDLKQMIPGLPNDIAIKQTKYNNNMYEVAVGHKLFYVSNDGKYLFFGNLIDIKTKKNLTEERTQELSKIDWNKLPLELAVKVINGNGKHKIAIFSDPDCPYCQMFEQKIAPNLKDTTMYTFLFPLPNHPNSMPESIAILASSDKAKTWLDWIRNKKAPPKESALNSELVKKAKDDIEKIKKIANDVVQVEGTPTIVLENGQILPGLLPADKMLEVMDKIPQK